MEHYNILPPDLADHATNIDLKRQERNNSQRITCFKNNTQVLCDLEWVCPGQKEPVLV